MNYSQDEVIEQVEVKQCHYLRTKAETIAKCLEMWRGLDLNTREIQVITGVHPSCLKKWIERYWFGVKKSDNTIMIKLTSKV